MKLKLLSAAATSIIAAVMLAPLQTAFAEECIVRDGNSEGRAGARSADSDGLACGTDARAGTSSIAIGSYSQAAWENSLQVAGADFAIAIGDTSFAKKTETIALGRTSYATAIQATAIGRLSEASGAQAVATALEDGPMFMQRAPPDGWFVLGSIVLQ